MLEAMARDPHGRAACVYNRLDEFSRAFVPAVPLDADSSATGPEFREMMTHFVAAPSIACAPVLNQRLHCGRAGGNGTVDQAGDNVLTSTMTGGLPTKLRHDVVLNTVATAMRECGLTVASEAEAFFSAVVPPAARQLLTRTIRPDLLFQLPGGPMRIGEFKCISYCPSWYGMHLDRDGVATRARSVPGEYLRHARTADSSLRLAAGDPANPHGPNLTLGPLEARLQSVTPVCALVVGGFAEASTDVHLLVGALAAMGARKLSAQLGIPGDQARARIRQLLLQRIGFAAARGIAQHRLQGLMFAAPLAARREADARAGGRTARILSPHALAAFCDRQGGGAAWTVALDRAAGG
jgi:hypothetical protein